MFFEWGYIAITAEGDRGNETGIWNRPSLPQSCAQAIRQVPKAPKLASILGPQILAVTSLVETSFNSTFDLRNTRIVVINDGKRVTARRDAECRL